MPEITSGAFWGENACSSKGKERTLIETKKDLSVDKYGGYSGENSAFFFIYKSKGESEHLNFAPFPLALATRKDDIHHLIETYAIELCREANETFTGIIIPQIYKYQKIEWNGQQFYLTGKKDIRNSAAVFMSRDDMAILLKYKTNTIDSNVEMIAVLKRLIERAKEKSERLMSQLKLDGIDKKVSSLNAQQIFDLICGLSSIFRGSEPIVNLDIIGGSKQAGRMQPDMNKKLNDSSNKFYVIDQSVTGMFERRRRIGL